VADRRVNLSRFILIAELLDEAYAGPAPLPDYLGHECGLAEDALSRLGAASGETKDLKLMALFGLTYLR
jgi:hypothetical protein